MTGLFSMMPMTCGEPKPVSVSKCWLTRSAAKNSASSALGLPVKIRFCTPESSVMSVLQAAQDLGANAWQTFFRVTLPLSIPGIISGITMVFLPSITTFAISLMLGSGKVYLAGDMIEELFISLGNKNVGSALSLILMILILISIWLMRKADPDGEGGALM